MLCQCPLYRQTRTSQTCIPPLRSDGAPPPVMSSPPDCFPDSRYWRIVLCCASSACGPWLVPFSRASSGSPILTSFSKLFLKSSMYLSAIVSWT
ncbi:hypothetical protein GMOD_00009886 [Pyrenophora seminiperda CCB06]|uniref:Uncharacterized protein n=1 Tax=Pyrenophora seminiperda CCB06 TaxID=1302712 RepID=A0A3M7ME74_9PLEO|nr:hypothetical protein GMOD_00009886 [Pyrenophora seminiperda CCB06]